MALSRIKRRQLRFGAWVVTLVAATAGGLLVASLVAPPFGAFWGLAVVVVPLVIADFWMRDEGGVPVLVYHSISERTAWLPWAKEIAVSPQTFEQHLKTLKAIGCRVIQSSEFLSERLSGKAIKGRPVVIHIDDGYLDNWVAAAPLLRQHNTAATIFISLDFIERGETLRPTLDDVRSGRSNHADLEWRGYMNWAEIQALRSAGLIDFQPHGIDHGRVEIGPEIVDELRPDNWRRMAWVQWAATSGNKSDWYRNETPPARPYGTPVRRNDAALAAPAWSAKDGMESQAAYEERVRRDLSRSREVLERELKTTVQVFCWPQNRTSPRAREIAREVGYLATTGGHGENRPSEDPRVISRLHVSADVLGWPCRWADNLAFAANVRLFQGNYYWYLPLVVLKACRYVFTPFTRLAAQAAT